MMIWPLSLMTPPLAVEDHTRTIQVEWAVLYHNKDLFFRYSPVQSSTVLTGVIPCESPGPNDVIACFLIISYPLNLGNA